MTQSPVSSRTSRILPVVVLTALGCLLLATLVDRWHDRTLDARERDAVRATASELARAVERELSQRVLLLAGLRAFAETQQGNRAALEAQFPGFAAGLLVGVDGVRALQIVHEGRITATWPLAGNEAVLGYNLYAHPVPEVADGVRRAVTSGQLVITGPVEILQGGSGLLVRLPVGGPPGRYPELVNIILDVPALLQDAGIGVAQTESSIQLLDASGRRIAGATRALESPERAVVRTGDGAWTLAIVPPAGWGATFARERRLVRIAQLLISLLLVGMAGLLFDRQARLQRAVADRTRALRDTNDELAREVTERRAAESALATRAAELRVALGTGQMGIWAWDVSTGEIAWSEGTSALFGRRPPPATYDALLGMLDDDDRASLHDAVRATLEHDAVFRGQYRLQTAGERDRWLYATAEVQRADDGTPRRLLGVVMDVTARVELERQLRQAQKMEAVGTLAGGIAHDFNNLLTAILGFARLADDSLAAPTAVPVAEVRADLGELVRAAERASLLTGQLLAFSRQQVVRPTMLDVNVVVADLQALLARLVDERIALRLDLADAPLAVRADAGQLSQVLLNLVVNARDAIAGHGHITVATRELTDDAAVAAIEGANGAVVEISVRDDGVGMSDEVRERMFEPFFTTKALGKGTGLGLSTVYGIITQAGGTIVVESAPGAGTCVRVRLPAVAAAGTRRTPARSTEAVRGGAERILVVEDEPGVRRLVAEILQRAGYAVDQAEHGREALALLEADTHRAPGTAPIALVLSDVVMPELGGLELATQLRRDRPSLPVLLMSGYPAGPVTVDAPLLTKPFAPEELLRHVRALLDASLVVAPLPLHSERP